MQLRRNHAIFIHEIWIKCVFQLPSPSPVPTLANECQLSPGDGSTVHVLEGEAHNQDAHLSAYFVNPIRHLNLPPSPPRRFLPLAIHHRRYCLDLGECWACSVVGDPPSQGFHLTWLVLFDVFVFDRSFRLQANNLITFEHFTR